MHLKPYVNPHSKQPVRVSNHLGPRVQVPPPPPPRQNTEPLLVRRTSLVYKESQSKMLNSHKPRAVTPPPLTHSKSRWVVSFIVCCFCVLGQGNPELIPVRHRNRVKLCFHVLIVLIGVTWVMWHLCSDRLLDSPLVVWCCKTLGSTFLHQVLNKSILNFTT